MKTTMEKTIYELDLFEMVQLPRLINPGCAKEYFKRVPGGWLYIIDEGQHKLTSTFIQYHDEFKTPLNLNKKYKLV